MKHLCYIYIYKYRKLRDVEVVLDHRFNYCMDRDSMTLSIERNDRSLPDSFWGSNIWSLTGIFGENAAGKTSIIRFILDVVVEGQNNKDVDGIIVYEQDGKLYVYHNKSYETELSLSIEHDQSIEVVDVCKSDERLSERLPRINTFFFMGHFSPEFSYNDLCTVGLSGLYNASEGYCLRNDLEKFANSSDPYMTTGIGSYLIAHLSQNNYRICRLLINEQLRNVLNIYTLPRYIFFAPNRGGQDGLKLNPIIREKIIPELHRHLDPPAIRGLVPDINEQKLRFIHFNLLSLIADRLSFDGYQILLNEWYEAYDESKGVFEQFQEFANSKSEGIKDSLLSIHYVLLKLFEKANYNENTGLLYLDSIADKEKIEYITDDVFRARFYLTARFFDMHYGQDINATSCTLSSGEQSCLNLFSRLYDAIELKPMQYDNHKAPRLLLLDEAEIGFHPEWQRRYVQMVLDFMRALKVVSAMDYQIVITSHSPLLLSDIPHCCSNFLRIKDGSTVNDRVNQNETFASNVFESYRNSFFLENGIIGEFAQEYIKNLEKRLGNIDDESVEDDILLIGDRRLKIYLMERRQECICQSESIDDLRLYYQHQLDKLNKEQ